MGVGVLLAAMGPAQGAPTFTVKAYNIVGGGGSNDNDINDLGVA